MPQAARKNLDIEASPSLHAPTNRSVLGIATGGEAPVTSPALELQMVLEDLLTPAEPDVNYARLALVGAAVLGAGTICLAFWWIVLGWTASVVS